LKGIKNNCSELASLYHAYGLIEFRCNNLALARTIFHEGIEICIRHGKKHDMTTSFLMHSLGMLELHANQWVEARDVFTSALTIISNQTQLLLGLALSNMKLGSTFNKQFALILTTHMHGKVGL